MPTNLQNFTQKDVKSENIPKVLGRLLFIKTPCINNYQHKTALDDILYY